MEDSLEKIKTIEPFIPAKNIIPIPVEFISTSIVIFVESVFYCVSIPIESISIESVKNSTPSNVISDYAYLLALNFFFFFSKSGKETFNNEKLKQGRVEPIKEETQLVNLEVDDEPKMVQISNTLTSSEKDTLVTLLKEFKEVFACSHEDMLGIDTNIVQHCIPIDPAMKPVKQKLRRMNLE